MLFILFLCLIGCYGDPLQRCPSNLPRNTRNRHLFVYGDKCYMFINDETVWNSARANCRRSGGDMITITTLDTQLFVQAVLINIWNRNGMWIGAHDRDREMDWVWVTGEKAKNGSGYENWDSGQPSCFLLLCYEDCACLRIDEGYKWHDYSCNADGYGYACQYVLLPPPPTTTTTPTTTATTTTVKTTTTPKPPTTAVHTTVPKVNLTTTILHSPETTVNQSGLNESGMIVGLVVSAGMIFLVIVAIFVYRRRRRKQYEETMNLGFHDVFCAAAPINENPTRVKDTNILAAKAYADDYDHTDTEERYVYIDDVSARSQCELPPLCKGSAYGKENIYDTVRPTSDEEGK